MEGCYYGIDENMQMIYLIVIMEELIDMLK